MNFQNHVHYTAQQTAGFQIRQQLKRRRVLDLPGGKSLWLMAAKVSCVALVIVCCLGIWIGTVAQQIHVSIQSTEAELHVLRNDQIGLLAERAKLMSAGHIRKQAEKTLALYVPDEGQVFKIR